VAYFRGRRLLGREIVLPPGYKGVLARTTERTVPLGEIRNDGHCAEGGMQEQDMQEEEDEEPEEQVKILEKVGAFERVVVWGHDALPGDEDQFVRGIGEWIGFSAGVNGYEEEDAEGKA
jgi:ribonuclease H2 subunit C